MHCVSDEDHPEKTEESGFLHEVDSKDRGVGVELRGVFRLIRSHLCSLGNQKIQRYVDTVSYCVSLGTLADSRVVAKTKSHHL